MLRPRSLKTAALIAATLVAGVSSAADGGAPASAPAIDWWADSQAKALEKERRECEAGDQGSCLWGATRPQSESERLRILEKACQLGSYGCVVLAYALAGGHQRVPVDVPRARALAERLCNDDSDPKVVGGACVILAQLTADQKRVRELLVRTCEHGWYGIRHAIYSNWWLPGQPTFHANCGDREHLGKPYRRRR